MCGLGIERVFECFGALLFKDFELKKLRIPNKPSDDAAPPVGAHESQTQNESRILKVGTCKNTHMCEEMPPEPKLSPFHHSA